MTDETTPQDSAAMSPASAGSQPVAWAAVGKNGVPMWLAYHRQDAEGAVVGMAEVAPLYLQPQPTLAAEEREAIETAAAILEECEDNDGEPLDGVALTLIGILNRLN